MASQTTTAPKRTIPKRAKTTTKPARTVGKNGAASTNGDKSATRARLKPTSEMTLEELSLRAYKMTYERLHGSKKKKKRRAARVTYSTRTSSAAKSSAKYARCRAVSIFHASSMRS